MGRRGLKAPLLQAAQEPALTPTPMNGSFTEALGLAGPMSRSSELPPKSTAPTEEELPGSLLEHTCQMIIYFFLAPVFVSNVIHLIFSKNLGWNDWHVLYSLRAGWWKECGASGFLVALLVRTSPAIKASLERLWMRVWAWRHRVAWIVGIIAYFVVLTHGLAIGVKAYHLAITYMRTGKWLAGTRVFSHRYADFYVDWALNDAWDDQPLEIAFSKSVGLWPDFDNFMYGLNLFVFVHVAMVFFYVTAPYAWLWIRGFYLRAAALWRKWQIKRRRQ
jgi:hypothetical protein